MKGDLKDSLMLLQSSPPSFFSLFTNFKRLWIFVGRCLPIQNIWTYSMCIEMAIIWNSFYGFSIDLENVFCHNLLSKTFTKVNEFTSKLEHFSKNSPRVCERVNTYSGLVYLPRTLTCCMYYTTFILTQCSKPGLQTKTSTLFQIKILHMRQLLQYL